MKDKRDECGCHRDCTHPVGGDPLFGVLPHPCSAPCVWPSCLTDAEHAEQLRELELEDGAGAGADDTISGEP